MIRKKRKLFFYILAIIFIVATPFILGYSLGYNFDFTKQTLQRTGGIFIKSRIGSLSIFLNGQFIKETSFISGGALITNLSSGEYILRLEKSGYTPWSKIVKVEPSLVTELRNILVMPRNIDRATSTKEEIALFKNIAAATHYQDDGFRITQTDDLIQNTGTTTITHATKVHSFYKDGDTIIFINKNGFVATLDLVNKDLNTLGRPGLVLGDKKIEFVPSPARDFILKDESGGIFILDAEKNLTGISGGVERIKFDNWGGKAILIKEKEIEILWMHDNPRQPFEKKGHHEVVLRTPTLIYDAGWLFYDNAHVVLETLEGIYLIETEGRGGRNNIELISGKTDEIITSPDMPNKIFFRKGKIWYSISI